MNGTGYNVCSVRWHTNTGIFVSPCYVLSNVCNVFESLSCFTWVFLPSFFGSILDIICTCCCVYGVLFLVQPPHLDFYFICVLCSSMLVIYVRRSGHRHKFVLWCDVMWWLQINTKISWRLPCVVRLQVSDAVTAFLKLFCGSAKIHQRRASKSGKSMAYYQVG